MAEKRECPNCGSVENYRSHRKSPLEKYLLGTIGVRPYRCLNCGVRLYAFSRFEEEPSVKNKAA